MVTRRTLQRLPDSSGYMTSDGRYRITSAYDTSTVTRGRGTRYWVVADTTGQDGPPSFCETLKQVREKYCGKPTAN